MKTVLSLTGFFLSATLFLGCGPKGGSEELEQLKAENQSLKKDLEQRDEDVNDFMKSFNEREQNLLSVQQKERSLEAQNVETSAELGGDVKTRIEAEI